MKRESWAGHSIRFVERSGEWWAVAQDVCEALGLRYVTKAMRSLKNVQKYNVGDLTNSQVSSRAREKEGRAHAHDKNRICSPCNGRQGSRGRAQTPCNLARQMGSGYCKR